MANLMQTIAVSSVNKLKFLKHKIHNIFLTVKTVQCSVLGHHKWNRTKCSFSLIRKRNIKLYTVTMSLIFSCFFWMLKIGYKAKPQVCVSVKLNALLDNESDKTVLALILNAPYYDPKMLLYGRLTLCLPRDLIAMPGNFINSLCSRFYASIMILSDVKLHPYHTWYRILQVL